MADRIYVGRAKYIKTRYGELCKIWLTPEGVEEINRNVDNNGSINLTMTDLKEADRAGNTHTLFIDDYRPDNSGRSRHGQPARGRSSDRNDNRNDDRRPARAERPEGGRRRNDGGFEDPPSEEQHRYSQSDRQPNPPPEESVDGIDDEIPF